MDIFILLVVRAVFGFVLALIAGFLFATVLPYDFWQCVVLAYAVSIAATNLDTN